MKLNKVLNILNICIIVFIILNILLPVYVKAEVKENFNFDYDDAEKPDGRIGTLTDKILKTAISVVRIAGVGISIIILTVIAMKYMMSAPGDRADIKKNAVPFVIGAVVLFGSSGILGILGNIAGEISAIKTS